MEQHVRFLSYNPFVLFDHFFYPPTKRNYEDFCLFFLMFFLCYLISFFCYFNSALRTGTLTPTGEKVTVGCLAKIEMNVQANAMRVTFRTLHPSATAALMATAKIALL